MSPQRLATIRDLVEEAKKRIVFLVICVVGLSYLMSLTSSSVWVNLPAATCLIILLRYFSLDFEMRRKAIVYKSKPSSADGLSQKSPECPKVLDRSNWRKKVNSPVVENAIDQFTRHLVSEWITDLWYSRLTPDKQGPEELVQIINGVFGKFSSRMRNVNLIDLLTRDLINLICSHLELFRVSQAKVEGKQVWSLTIEQRDVEIRRILSAENKLHPALFSAEAEHKVLQHLMDGLISFTFRPEDLQCSFFRYTVRELLACAVMRPVLNLASPRFINERIESLVISMTKAKEGVSQTVEASQAKPTGSSKISADYFSRFLDPSVTGVELVQLRNDQSQNVGDSAKTENVNGTDFSKDPLLSVDTQSSRSWSSLTPNTTAGDEQGIQQHSSAGEWGDMLDLISRRKTEVLAPENFENMWAKGRNYKKKGEKKLIEQVPQHSSVGKHVTVGHAKEMSKAKGTDTAKLNPSDSHTVQSGRDQHRVINCSFSSHPEDNEPNHMRLEGVESESSSGYNSEDEETGNITGLDSPGTKVWDGRTNRNLGVSHIHHPLENSGSQFTKKTSRGQVQYRMIPTNQSGRKRYRLNSHKLPVWQEVERTSFLSGDGQDILSPSKGHPKTEDSSDDSDTEFMSRVNSGATASSSVPSISISQSHAFTVNSVKRSLMTDSFFKLRCEVLGANIVKSGSKMFAVYSISVTDVNSHSWSIKRRFRHFEELHRRLREFPEYNLHLPPKHFLSTGLDVLLIQERCKLLDRYLKKLLQLPTVSGSIEVWDFLSVDSQTYAFSSSFSIVETLSVDLDDKPPETSKKLLNVTGPVVDQLSSRGEHLSIENRESSLQLKNNSTVDGLRLDTKGSSHSSVAGKEHEKSFTSESDPNGRMQQTHPSRNLGKMLKERETDGLEEISRSLADAATDPSLPTEWIPPMITVPMLDFIDVIFQLQDGGWIRRKAFWVVKQVLQLGMGDALDDWLIEKIQLLRKGSIVASIIKRIEQILWPDGIFITKHPKRQRLPPSRSPSMSSPCGQQPSEIASLKSNEEQQQQEADRRAKFVYELIIDKAPAPITGLVGHKEYEQCAKDIYFFLQSSVCLKQLMFDLLELLLLSAFPELDYVFKQLHEEKSKFGEFKSN